MKFPMAFFDTTPSGRIINRFSRDTETMDIILPGIIIQFLGCITSIITTLAIVCVATGWFTLALPPIMFLYISVQRFYIPACRELQRIESISRSPIYSGLGEAVNGVETIRAFRQERHFISISDKLIQHNADALSPRNSPVDGSAPACAFSAPSSSGVPRFWSFRVRCQRASPVCASCTRSTSPSTRARHEHGDGARDKDERG